MYYYVNDEGDIKFDKTSVLLVPEFAEFVSSKKWGWNFFQYIILFNRRSPFGMLSEEIRDQKVSAIITLSPLDKEDFRTTRNFYKDPVFKKISSQLLSLFPDSVYDNYIAIVNKIDALIAKMKEVDISSDFGDDPDELSYRLSQIEGYQKLISSLMKSRTDLESEMSKRSTLSGGGGNDYRIGSLKKINSK